MPARALQVHEGNGRRNGAVARESHCMSRIFPTAQDAENAFYEALERCDLEAMMAVWAEDEEVICVHPGGERLTGQDQLRASWAQIFSAGAQARLQVSNQVAISGVMLAVHSVHENFSLPNA